VTVGLAVYLAVLFVVAAAALVGVVLLIRALIGIRAEGPPPWWAVLLGALVLLAVPAVAAAAYFRLPAPLTERTLLNSIDREENSSFEATSCSKEELPQSWTCELADPSGNFAEYSVTAGQRCWYANRTDNLAGTGLPLKPEGCAKLRDVVLP
jgi:hypothetical protein